MPQGHNQISARIIFRVQLMTDTKSGFSLLLIEVSNVIF